MTTSTLANNYQATKEKISLLEQRYQRHTDEVCLIAVSKTRSVEEIRSIASLGQRHFGENYVQEALDKITQITDIPLIWHFIGPIQKNKTKLIAEHFDWVHSVDREVVATRLNDQRPKSLPKLNICLQINIDNEKSKSGIPTDELSALAKSIAELPNLTLRGLMAIPTATDDIAQQMSAFKKMNVLFSELKSHYNQVDTLSMGMSNDFETAIANGSTMIRIGTALFGPRNYS